MKNRCRAHKGKGKKARKKKRGEVQGKDLQEAGIINKKTQQTKGEKKLGRK